MEEFRQRRIFRNIFFSRLVFLVFLFVTVLLGVSVYEIYGKSRRAELRSQGVETEIKEMEINQDRLRANLDRLEAEGGLEEELRTRFQIKKPDENYVVILENKSIPATNTPTQSPQSFFQKFLDFFDIF